MGLKTDMQLVNNCRTTAATALLTLGALLLAPAQADISKASDWVGQSVVTADGKPLGRVEDLAIDLEEAKIAYLVVSIGSFLIDDSLIAVHPDALAPASNNAALVLHSDNLSNARRFGVDGWPSRADVLPSEQGKAQPEVSVSDSVADNDQRGFDRGGSATISDGRRTATYADGEARVEPIKNRARRSTPATPTSNATAKPGASAVESTTDAIDTSALPALVDPRTLALPSFKSLDLDNDGLLNRREIGARLGLSEAFPGVDVDGSGAVDRFEFDLLKDARGNAD